MDVINVQIPDVRDGDIFSECNQVAPLGNFKFSVTGRAKIAARTHSTEPLRKPESLKQASLN
jgi:hypothetical protein